jgi:hypothetical protein
MPVSWSLSSPRLVSSSHLLRRWPCLLERCVFHAFLSKEQLGPQGCNAHSHSAAPSQTCHQRCKGVHEHEVDCPQVCWVYLQ